MIEKDYIMRLVADLGRVIAKLLFLKTTGNRKDMEQVVYDGFRMAGLDDDPLNIDENAVVEIEDERVLASLSEAISIYLSVDRNQNLVRINEMIKERLKEKKTLVFNNE